MQSCSNKIGPTAGQQGLPDGLRTWRNPSFPRTHQKGALHTQFGPGYVAMINTLWKKHIQQHESWCMDVHGYTADPFFCGMKIDSRPIDPQTPRTPNILKRSCFRGNIALLGTADGLCSDLDAFRVTGQTNQSHQGVVEEVGQRNHLRGTRNKHISRSFLGVGWCLLNMLETWIQSATIGHRGCRDLSFQSSLRGERKPAPFSQAAGAKNWFNCSLVESVDVFGSKNPWL